MKIKSLKELFNRLFGMTLDGDTICKVLDNVDAPKEIILKSSTNDSTKKFKITVIDAGTITATEITD